MLSIFLAALVAYLVAMLVLARMAAVFKWSDRLCTVLDLLLVALTLSWVASTAQIVVDRSDAENKRLQVALQQCGKKEPTVEVITERGVNL